MNWIRLLVIAAWVSVLTACGGGGGNAGTPLNASSTATPVAAADFFFELDKSTLVNSGAEQALLKVTALDGNRNTLADVPVVVSLDGNGVLSGKSGASTDAAGQFSAHIGIGSDKSNRTIHASMTVGGVTKVASVVVTGSQIAVTPVPATPLPGQQVTLQIAATDSAGSAIPNVDLTLSGSAGVAGSTSTDVAGIKSVTFMAPSTVGTYDIVVSGLNVSTTKTLQVIAAGANSVPAAVGTVSSASVSPQPTVITTNLAGSTLNRSKLSAKFLASGNVGIPNMRVRFEIVAPTLGAGEMISTGDATVYTNASGIAEADYIAGTRSSPTNGVQLRACYSAVDFTSASDCPAFVSANLTVAGAPLSISITDNNTLTKGMGGIAYLRQFLIQVNDASGLAVKGAVVTASVDITHYGKGPVWGTAYANVPLPTLRDWYADTPLPVSSALAFVRSLQASTYAPSATERIWCANEDVNRNGYLDSGEDLNGDGAIEPRKAEIVISYVNGNLTDGNGQLLVQVSYGQNMGGWLAYTLRATTGVAGSEGDVSKAYVTGVSKDDESNGSFLTPPFGSGSCVSWN